MTTNNEVHFDMIRRLRVADYITLSNALCGVLCIFSAMQHSFIAAHTLIFLGYEFDRFDGIVARWRDECTEMGKQLDSFSDLVSFCVAPAVMLYCFGFDAPLEKAALTIYVLCGVARLARFNVAAHLVPKNADGKALYHEGLATAYAALIISTTVAVLSWMSWTTADLPLSIVFAGSWCEFHPVMGLLVILSFMMASQRLKLEIDGSVSIPVITLAIFAGCWSCSPPSTGRYEI